MQLGEEIKRQPRRDLFLKKENVDKEDKEINENKDEKEVN